MMSVGDNRSPSAYGEDELPARPGLRRSPTCTTAREVSAPKAPRVELYDCGEVSQ